MSLTSLGGFASNAFDTARSTWKAMAEAAVPPADGPPETAPVAEPVAAEPAPKKGVRRGTLLDAYA
jgi:hypothetical protein